MAAPIGALRAELSIDYAQFEQDLAKAEKAVAGFSRKCQAIGRELRNVGVTLTAALTVPILMFARTASRSAAEARDAFAQVEQAVTSMGGAAGRTAPQLQQAAKDLQRLSTFDDDDILRNVTANMLTFGQVAGEQFDRAQRAAVDIATRLQSELQPAALMVGKALNDPIRGLTAMRRVGIQFTADQEAMIRGFVETNNLAAAQGVMLDELERQFGGAGQAARDAVPGSDAIDAWREFQETFGDVVLDILDRLAPVAQAVMDAFSGMSKGMQQAIVVATLAAAALGPILAIAGQLAIWIGALGPLWQGMAVGIQTAMAAAGITSWATAIGALIGSLARLAGIWGLVIAAVWPFRKAITDAVESVAAVVGDQLWPALRDFGTAVSSVFQSLQSGPVGEFVGFMGWAVAELAGLFTRIAGTVIVRALTVIVRAVGGTVQVIADLFRVLGALITGDFSGALEAGKDLVGNWSRNVLEIMNAVVPGAREAVKAVAGDVQQYLGDRISGTLEWIKQRFPLLVTVVRVTAVSATAWARRLYEGIKTWIQDNLGPLIRWAQRQITRLNNLFDRIRRRQADLRARDAEAEPTAAPASTGGAGVDLDAADTAGGGGGGGGGASRAADRVDQARERLTEGLERLNEAVSHAADQRAMPRVMEQARDMRADLADLAAEARAAGVDMAGFDASIRALGDGIDALERAGLAREAAAFRREVEETGQAVSDFGRGDLPPLEAALRRVDERYAGLREELTDLIAENRVLAESNEDAARTMAALEGQLADLAKAHAAAAAAARAQHMAEQGIADLRARADMLATEQDISDLREARGEGAAIGSYMQDLRATEQALERDRIRAQLRLAELEAARDEARRTGDVQEAARLDGLVARQAELYALVEDTTAEQIVGAERVRAAFSRFVDDLTDNLTDAVMNWKGDLEGLGDILIQLVRDALIRPAMERITGGLGGVLQSLLPRFGGFFSKGGDLRAGEWGITGENGPEPFFAGTRTTIEPNSVLGASAMRETQNGGGQIIVDARGAGPREIDQLRNMFDSFMSNRDRIIWDTVNEGFMRDKIAKPSFK